MRSALAYEPRRGPLQAAAPAAAIAFLAALVLVAFAFSNPLLLAGSALAVSVAGLIAGARRAVAAALRGGIVLAVLIVAVNGLVTSRGDTVLLRLGDLPLLGQTDVTAEALAAGGVIAARLLVTLLAFAVYSACVDPDRVLRLLRPLARRSALTAALISRMVPLAAADAVRLREAGRLRGPGAAPVNRVTLARRLLAGSLDRAVDAAATLELRGFGLTPRRTRPAADRSRHDRAFWAAAVLLVICVPAAGLAGAGTFDAYPSIVVATDPATVVLAAALPLVATGPFVSARLASRRRSRPDRAGEALRA